MKPEPKFKVGDTVRVRKDIQDIYSVPPAERCLVTGVDPLRNKMRLHHGEVIDIKYMEPEKGWPITGYDYHVSFNRFGVVRMDESWLEPVTEEMEYLGQAVEERADLETALENHPIKCKCGGTYWPEGKKGCWFSRMGCGTCGDYYDLSGLPERFMGLSVILCSEPQCGNDEFVPEHLVHLYLSKASCRKCEKPLVGSRVTHVTDNAPIFKTIQDAQTWVSWTKRPIDEQFCPMLDIEKPTEADLIKCGQICTNHWACHTFRHLRGTRKPKCPTCGGKGKWDLVNIDGSGLVTPIKKNIPCACTTRQDEAPKQYPHPESCGHFDKALDKCTLEGKEKADTCYLKTGKECRAWMQREEVMKYACGHTSAPIILDNNPLSLTAFNVWQEENWGKPEGICWECWNKKERGKR